MANFEDLPGMKRLPEDTGSGVSGGVQVESLPGFSATTEEPTRSLSNALRMPPPATAAASTAYQQADRLQVPPSLTLAEPQRIAEVERVQRAEAFEQSSPKSAKFLAGNQRALDNGWDSLDQMAAFEAAFTTDPRQLKPLANVGKVGGVGVAKGATTLFHGGAQFIDDAIASWLDPSGEMKPYTEDPFAYRSGVLGKLGAIFGAAEAGASVREFHAEAAQRDAERRTEAMGALSEIVRPIYEDAGKGLRAAYSGVESAAQQTALFGSSLLLTRDPIKSAELALGGMVGVSGLDSYTRARDQGLSFEESAAYAARDAAIEYGTERVPFGFLKKWLKGDDTFLKAAANIYGSEILGEQSATLLQDANAWLTLPENKDKTLEDFALERPGAAVDTLIATLVGTTLQVAPVGAAKVILDSVEANHAREFEARMGRLIDLSREVSLRVNDPKSFTEYANTFLQEGDKTQATVFLDRDALTGMVETNSEAVDELLSKMPKAQDAIITAGPGGVVELNVGELLTALPGSVLEQAIVENLRASAGAMSAKEAKAITPDVFQQRLSEAAMSAQEKREQNKKFKDSSSRIRERLVTDLVKRGRFTQAEAGAMVAPVTAFAEAMAHRLGILPEEAVAAVYGKPLNVTDREGAQAARAAARAEGDTLEQRPLKLDLTETGKGARMLRDEAAGTSLIYRVENGELVIESLSVFDRKKRGQGAAKALLGQVAATADIAGMPVRLEAVAQQRGVDIGRLVKLYEQAGFSRAEGAKAENVGGVPMRRAPVPVSFPQKDVQATPLAAFEVAPDPRDGALAEAWRAAPEEARDEFSKAVVADVGPLLLDALGIGGTYHAMLGGYLGDVNRSFGAAVDPAQLLRVADALAYVFDQESVAVFSGVNAPGLAPTAAVVIEVGAGLGKPAVEQIYTQMETLGRDKVGGFSYHEGLGRIVVLDFGGLGEELARGINEALGDRFDVATTTVYSKFVSREQGEDYASRDRSAAEGGNPSAAERARLSDLRARVASEVDGFIARHKGHRRETGSDDAGAARETVRQPAVIDTGAVGRGYTAFFTNLSLGTKGKPHGFENFEPVLDVTPVAPFVAEYEKHRGNFDDHIGASIPTFRELQTVVGAAIAQTYPTGDMLDIGASEGALIKAISAATNGGMRTVGLDPNFAMANHFNTASSVPGATYVTEAFGDDSAKGQTAWVEGDTLVDRDGEAIANPYAGNEVKFYTPDRAFDVVHEAMVFQFISGDRENQVSRIKELLKPDGVVILEEKMIGGEGLTPEAFKANEDKKDAFKQKFFTDAEIAAKAKNVGVAERKEQEAEEAAAEAKVVGMADLMASPGELERVLSSRFKFVVQFWDAGNFKGYMASDSREALDKLLANMLPTQSEYSTVQTPREIGETETGRLEQQFEPDALLIAEAKRYFGTTIDPREAGYILPDGAMLDLSGRHYAPRDHWRHLRGSRTVDHRDLAMENAHNGQTLSLEAHGGQEKMVEFMRRTGAVRFDHTSGIASFRRPPTAAQIAVIGNVLRGQELTVSYYAEDGSDQITHEAEMQKVTPQKLAKFVVEAQRGEEDNRLAQYGAFVPPRFESAVIRAIKGAKQAKMSAAEWKKAIAPGKAADVTKEELEFQQFDYLVDMLAFRAYFNEAFGGSEGWSPGRRAEASERFLLGAQDGRLSIPGALETWLINKGVIAPDMAMADAIAAVKQAISKVSLERLTLAAEVELRNKLDLSVSLRTDTPEVQRLARDMREHGVDDAEVAERILHEVARLADDRLQEEADEFASRVISETEAALEEGETQDLYHRLSEPVVVVLDPANPDDADNLAFLAENGIGERPIPGSGVAHPDLFDGETAKAVVGYYVYAAGTVAIEGEDGEIVITEDEEAPEYFTHREDVFSDRDRVLRGYLKGDAHRDLFDSYATIARRDAIRLEVEDEAKENVNNEVEEERMRLARRMDDLGFPDDAVIAVALPRWTGEDREPSRYDINAVVEGAIEEPFELLVKWSQNPAEAFTENVHFPSDENVVGFIRGYWLTASDGKRTLVFDELQSDWGQTGRTGGFGPRAVGAKWRAMPKMGLSKKNVAFTVDVALDDGSRRRVVFSAGDIESSRRITLFAEDAAIVGFAESDAANFLIHLANVVRTELVSKYGVASAQDSAVEFLSVSYTDAFGEKQETKDITAGSSMSPLWLGWNAAAAEIKKASSAASATSKLFDSEMEARRWVSRSLNIKTREAQNAVFNLSLDQSAQYSGEVPDMPFKSTEAWASLLLKHAFAYAIDQEAERFAIVPGYVHQNRWTLSRFVSRAELVAQWRAGEEVPTDIELRMFDAAGNPVGQTKEIPAPELGKYFTKELAAEAMAKFESGEQNVIFGDAELKVRGEDLRPFYDVKLPSLAKKLANRFGGEVTRTDLVSESGKPKAGGAEKANTASVVIDRTHRGDGVYQLSDEYVIDDLVERIEDERTGTFARMFGATLPMLLVPGDIVAVVATVNGEQVGIYSQTLTADDIADFTSPYRATGWIGNEVAVPALQGLREVRTHLVQQKTIDAFAVNVTDKMRDEMRKPLSFYQRDKLLYGDYDPMLNLITLLESRDLSTFLHESAHAFLEISMHLAAQDGAPQELVDDMMETLAWMGYPNTTPGQWIAMPVKQRRNGHEQFARSFEAYLYEGNAPSIKLRKVFDTFKRWLDQVYTSLKEFLRRNPNAGTLNDSIRGVMDRMLATPEEIAVAKRARELEPLFTKPDQPGAAEARAEGYEALLAEADETAKGDILARKLRDMSWFRNAHGRIVDRLRADAKEKRKRVREDVRQQLTSSGVYAALQYLRRGILPPGMFASDEAPMKLSAQALDEMYAEEHPLRGKIAAMKRGGRYALTSPSGVHPDMLASVFGFESGEALVEALATAQPLNEAVEDATDAEMLQRYGDITSDAALAKAADAAIHNEAAARVLATEAAALDKLGKLPGMKVPDMLRAVAALARETLGRVKVGNLQPLRYAAAEATAGREARAAYARGEYDKAAAAKRKQLLQHRLARQAYEAEKEVADILKYLRKFRKADFRKKLGGEDLEQLDALLARFDLRVGVTKKAREAAQKEALRTFIVSRSAELSAAEPDIESWLLDEGFRKHYKDLTLNEFRSLRDAVRQLEYLARREREMYKAIRNQTFQQERAAIIAKLQQAWPDAFDEAGNAKPTHPGFISMFRNRARAELSAAVGENLGIEAIVEILEGGGIGPMHDSIFRRLSEAQSSEAELLNKVFEFLKPSLLGYSLPQKMAFGSRVIGKVGGQEFSREAALCVALFYGSETGRQRLSNFGMSDSQLREVIALLSDQDVQLANTIWAMFDELLWPLKESLDKRTTGASVGKVEALNYEVNGKQFRGGYFPINYDPRSSAKAEDVAAGGNVAELRRGYRQPKPSNKSSKARVEKTTLLLSLSLRAMVKDIGDTVHDISFREAVADVNRLLNDEQIRAAIINVLDLPTYSGMKNNVADVAAKPRMPFEQVSRIVGWAKRNTVIMLMSGLKTALQNYTGLAPAMAMGPAFAATMMKNVPHGFNPRRYRQMLRLSPFMREYFTAYDRDLGKQIDKFTVGGKITPDTATWLALMGLVNRSVGTIVWWTGYETELNRRIKAGESRDTAHAEAVNYADHAIRKTQGSGRDVDLPRIMRDQSGFKQLFTMFFSYFNAQRSLLVTSAYVARSRMQTNPAVAVAKFAGAFVVILLPAALTIAMMDLIFVASGGDAGDDDEEWTKRYGKGAALYLMQMSLVTRLAGPFAMNLLGEEAKGFKRAMQATPVTSGPTYALEAALVAGPDLAEGEGDARDVKTAIMGASFVTGLPGKLLSDMALGADAYLSDEASPLALLAGPPVKPR